MNKKKLIPLSIASLFLINGNLFAANTFLIPVTKPRSTVRIKTQEQAVLRQNITIKNIKTLKQLNRALDEIEKILQQKKLLKKEKEMSEKEKENMERKKRQRELNKMQKQLDYQQKIFQIKQEKKILEATELRESPKYINALISLLKQKILLVEKELKLIKLQKTYPIKVFNVYKIGNSPYGYVSIKTLQNAASMLEANKNLQKRIRLKTMELENELKSINKTIIKANPDVFAHKIISFIRIFQEIKRTLDEIGNIKAIYLNRGMRMSPDTFVMSVYKKPDTKNLVKIKEGDMVTNDIQVKKIVNGYAILGLLNE